MKLEFLAGDEKRFAEFISNLDEGDKIAILSHNDLDGLCSAVIASKVLGKIDYLKFMAYDYNMMKEVAIELKKKKINKLFVFDLVLDSEAESVLEISKFAEIVYIDHHQFEKDFNSDRIVMIKTRTEEPASFACYYLFSKIQKIHSWIAALGIISDRVDKYNEKNCKEVFRDFSLEGCEDLWKVVEDTNFALIYFRDNEEKLFDMFARVKNSRDISLGKYAMIVEKETNKVLSDFEKNHEKHGDLKIYFFKSKFSLSSIVSTILSIKRYQDNTIVILADYGSHIKVSARNSHSKVNCVELLKRAMKNIPKSNSGGHIPAAGGEIPHKYLSQFKKNLIKVYDKLK